MPSCKPASTFAAAFFALAALMTAQETKVSPAATAQVTLKGKEISIAYSRPYKRGRSIMGGLVPYGRVWRTGADDATSLTTAVDLKIGTADVPAGKYTLYTLPAEGTWKLIVNKQTGQWGTEYDQSQDLARVDMQTAKTDSLVEQFKIFFTRKGADSADLVMEWENTRVLVPVHAR